MRPRVSTNLLILLVASVAVAGCGDPRQVTYVDPNGPGTGVQAGDGGEPIKRYGAAAAERAKALIRVRASLAVARTMAVTDPDAAAEVVRRTIEDDLPMVDARAAAAIPTQVEQLHRAIEALRDAPPADVAGYNRAVRSIIDGQLAKVEVATVPAAARQDPSFRAAMLYETLLAAAASYEASFEGGTSDITLDSEYRVAYGLLIDASTRQLESLPEGARANVRRSLDQLSRRATPGPTPPDEPRDPELVVGDLGALADEVAIAARIDPTYPSPDPATPDELRSLKRAVGAAIEARERGDVAGALQQLRDADRTLLMPAAAGVASVSPSLLAEIEDGIIVRLPATIRTDESLSGPAAEVDALIDDATSLVEEELELLREAG